MAPKRSSRKPRPEDHFGHDHVGVDDPDQRPRAEHRGPAARVRRGRERGRRARRERPGTLDPGTGSLIPHSPIAHIAVRHAAHRRRCPPRSPQGVRERDHGSERTRSAGVPNSPGRGEKAPTVKSRVSRDAQRHSIRPSKPRVRRALAHRGSSTEGAAVYAVVARWLWRQAAGEILIGALVCRTSTRATWDRLRRARRRAGGHRAPRRRAHRSAPERAEHLSPRDPLPRGEHVARETILVTTLGCVPVVLVVALLLG